jgi:CPA2 family monovalent cation:H+ antiporter-2
MSIVFSRDLFFLLSVGLAGGVIARLLKLHTLVGFILAGVLLRIIVPFNTFGAEQIAQLGLIFLLFTTGLELSFSKLGRVLKVAAIGASLQIFLVSIICTLLFRLFSIDIQTAVILSLGFSLSSTAVVVKLLMDRGETETMHGRVMIGWLLMQDLAVIPILLLVSLLGQKTSIGPVVIVLGLLKIAGIILAVLLIGKFLVPKILHLVGSLNLRELLLLVSVIIALGTALLVSLFGISASIGAFLAGIVIAESIEKHAVFAEIRPLRDLFVGIFFVSLGLLITPLYLAGSLWIILFVTLAVVFVKFVCNLIVGLTLGYHGKTAVTVALGLSQIGEFSFIIFSLAGSFGLISQRAITIGVSSALLSLVFFPAIYKQANLAWRVLKNVFSRSSVLSKYFLGWDRKSLSESQVLEGHVIICGYGRVGGWVGKALESMKTEFVAVEYNLALADDLRKQGKHVIYGDPTEREVLEAAGVKNAKAIVIAIPDREVQEAVITLSQTLAPDIKIISRVHGDEDWERLKTLKVDKLVQPEFEGAVAIVRSMLISMGKSKEEINTRISSLRHSHSLAK